jgi:FSR family fosmidomycin resistance protein-like MFS transporter
LTEESVSVAVAAPETEEDTYDQKGVAVAAFAHFSHDLYPSFIGPLVPAIQDKLGISLAMASLMIPAQQMPSILQPFIGLLADRTSRRWFVVLSPATAAVSLSSLGLAPNIAVVLLLLLVSGLSSATFHAPAVALVGEYGGHKMGRAMSIFMAGGEMSRTLGPILITGAIALFTLEGSFVVMIVGIVASVVLYLTLDTTATDARRQAREKVNIRPILRARRLPIAGLLGYSILTGIATTPLHFFLVKFLVEKGHGEWYGGFALSTLFASGVVGGLVGGNLSDRIGRRAMLAAFTLATPPLLYTYLWIENGSWWVLAMLAIAGAITMAPRSVVLAVGAELLPEARGPMAGMLLALGFVSMSIAALVFGAVSDRIGITQAYWFIPAIWFLSLPCIALLPKRGAPLAMPG